MRFNKIEAILFDIDGTLLDTTELIFRCYEHTINTHNLSLKTRKEITIIFGKPLEACYRHLFPDENSEVLRETHISFQEKNLHISKPFINVKQALCNLKIRGYEIAAVTTRSKRTSIKSLELADIMKYFKTVVSREDIINPKPYPDALFKALAFLKVSPTQAVMVGDTPVDIMSGKNAKIKTIGVTYGPLGDAVISADPDAIVSNISEINSLINR